MPSRILARVLTAFAALLIAAPAVAYDASRAPRYASPDMYRPNVDRIVVNGTGSTGPIETMSATATGASAGQTLGGWFSSIVLGTPTVTSLRAYSRFFISPDTLITVGGYTSLGDGGGGTFRWSNTSTATDDGVLTINPTGNGGAGRWLRIFNGTLPIEAAGGICNGGADDTAAFRRAVAALAALGRGGIIAIGPKACIVSGTIDGAANVFFRGNGRESTAILTNVPTGDVFRFGTAAASYNSFGMSDLLVGSTVTRTSGALIAISGSRGTFRSIGLRGGYDGITIDNYGNQAIVAIYDLLAENMGNECISLGKFSTAPALFANGLHLTASTLAQCQTSMALYAASGVYVQDVESYQSKGHAFAFIPTTSHLGIQGAWFNQTLADSPTANGWFFAGTGKISEVKLTASQASSAGGHGIDIEPGTNLDSLLITDFQSTFNAQHGLRIGGGYNVTVRGGEFYYNGNGSGGVGIAVENNVKGFTIQGINGGYGGWAKVNNLTMKQTNCIYVVGPTNDNYIVTGNRCMGNTATNDQIHDGGTGANKIVEKNLSY